MNPCLLPLDDHNCGKHYGSSQSSWFWSYQARDGSLLVVCNDHSALRVNGAADSGRSPREVSIIFLSIEFIRYHETSGCGLMGLGEKHSPNS